MGATRGAWGDTRLSRSLTEWDRRIIEGKSGKIIPMTKEKMEYLTGAVPL